MEYTLKNKMSVTKELLADLETKSWQEIDYLQAQITNIEAAEENQVLIQLLKNLLTSYYVFTGGLENLNSPENFIKVAPDVKQIKEPIVTVDKIEDFPESKEDFETFEATAQELESEPFEYFVDFDEPVGDPISDDDLYFNK